MTNALVRAVYPERWSVVQDAYIVSTHGNVYSLHTHKRICATRLLRSARVILESFDSIPKRHQLVAYASVDNCPVLNLVYWKNDWDTICLHDTLRSIIIHQISLSEASRRRKQSIAHISRKLNARFGKCPIITSERPRWFRECFQQLQSDVDCIRARRDENVKNAYATLENAIDCVGR